MFRRIVFEFLERVTDAGRRLLRDSLADDGKRAKHPLAIEVRLACDRRTRRAAYEPLEQTPPLACGEPQRPALGAPVETAIRTASAAALQNPTLKAAASGALHSRCHCKYLWGNQEWESSGERTGLSLTLASFVSRVVTRWHRPCPDRARTNGTPAPKNAKEQLNASLVGTQGPGLFSVRRRRRRGERQNTA